MELSTLGPHLTPSLKKRKPYYELQKTTLLDKTTIIISGHTQSGGTAPNTTFNVQTSVTQRLYDQ